MKLSTYGLQNKGIQGDQLSIRMENSHINFRLVPQINFCDFKLSQRQVETATTC